jgi:alpha-aminoadipate carrier protein LysW
MVESPLEYENTYPVPLDQSAGKNLNIISTALIGEGGFMILCPECETNLDVDEEGVDEGEVISCPECGTDFEVVTTVPLELKPVEAGYEEEEEEVEESEDGDYS